MRKKKMKVRNIKFKFDKESNENIYLSTFLQTFSALLPAGERFFVDSVRQYRTGLNSRLDKDVGLFIGQEAMHAREHTVYNRINAKKLEKIEKRVKRLLDFGQKHLPKSARLSITVALEHYTALIAEKLLTDERLRSMVDKSVIDFWTWHAIEETEHKSVAYDVYETKVNSYLLRVLTMIPVTVFLFVIQTKNHLTLLSELDELTLKGLLGWNMFLWNPIDGIFSSLIPNYLDFYSPLFHPSNHDTSGLLLKYNDYPGLRTN